MLSKIQNKAVLPKLTRDVHFILNREHTFCSTSIIPTVTNLIKGSLPIGPN
jgi:hypothetical protein